MDCHSPIIARNVAKRSGETIPIGSGIVIEPPRRESKLRLFVTGRSHKPGWGTSFIFVTFGITWELVTTVETG